MKYIVSKNLIVQKLDSSIVIFDGKRSVLYTLNETAGLIFKMIRRKKTSDEIKTYICSIYDIEKQKAQKDVEKIISSFKKNGLIFSSPFIKRKKKIVIQK